MTRQTAFIIATDLDCIDIDRYVRYVFENANSPKVVVTVLFFLTLPALSVGAKFTLRPSQFGDDHDGKGGLEVRPHLICMFTQP